MRAGGELEGDAWARRLGRLPALVASVSGRLAAPAGGEAAGHGGWWPPASLGPARGGGPRPPKRPADRRARAGQLAALGFYDRRRADGARAGSLRERVRALSDGVVRQVSGGRLGVGRVELVAPVAAKYTVSSAFGPRGGRCHNGIDLAAEPGTPILASERGTVTYVGEEAGYGKVLEIEHGNGWKTLYAHSSRIHKRAGDRVRRRDVVASVGSTGRSTGPHLHFEVRDPGDRPHDPELFVKLR